MPSKAHTSDPVVRTQLVATGPSGENASTGATDLHGRDSSAESQVLDSPPRANINSMAPGSAAGGVKKAEISGAQDGKEVKEEGAEHVISVDENVPELSPPKAPKPASRVSSLRGEGRGGSKQEVDEFGSPKSTPELDPHSRGSTGESLNLVLGSPGLKPKSLVNSIDRTTDTKLPPSRLAPVPLSQPAEEDEAVVDPYKYLINLEDDTTDLRKLDPPVQAYLRLLGRNTEMERIRNEGYDKVTVAKSGKIVEQPVYPTAAKLADAELAGGWLVLKNAMYPPPGKARIGFFFEPQDITSKAVQACPRMPWLYDMSEEEVERPFCRPTTLDLAYGGDGDQPSLYDYSSYVRPSRDLFLTNAIVPLPPLSIGSNDPQYLELIHRCYGEIHPLQLLGNDIGLINGNNEDLLLTARDYRIGKDFLLDPYDKAGKNVARNEAYLAYLDRNREYE